MLYVGSWTQCRTYVGYRAESEMGQQRKSKNLFETNRYSAIDWRGTAW